jgi:hypothetical protein
LELSQNIVRTTVETTISNLYNSLHPLYYLTMIIPYLFGKHFIGYWGSDYPWGNWENFLYIGILPILFIPFVFKWKDKKLLIFFLSNLFIVFFLLLGKYNDLSSIINRILPLSDSLTMLTKMTVFFHFFIVIISTVGLNILIREKYSKREVFIYLILLLVVVFVLVLANTNITTMLHFENRPLPSPDALIFIKNNIIQSRFIFIFSAVSMIIMFILKKTKYTYYLVIIYLLDIFLSAGNFNPIEISPGQPERYFGGNKVTEIIKNTAGIYRVDNLWPRNLNMISDIETTYGYHTIETKSYHDSMMMFNPQTPNMINLLNVKYLISDKDLSSINGMKSIFQNVWENSNMLPRVSFVPYVRIVRTKAEMASIISDKSFDPRIEVLINEDDLKSDLIDRKIPVKNPVSSVEGQKTDVRIVSYDTGNINVQVNFPKSGYLLFNQLQYPGWKAIINGKERKLLPADLSFYALPISEKDRDISFVFDSKPLKIGLWITIITWIFIFLSFVVPFTRKYYTITIGK